MDGSSPPDDDDTCWHTCVLTTSVVLTFALETGGSQSVQGAGLSPGGQQHGALQSRTPISGVRHHPGVAAAVHRAAWHGAGAHHGMDPWLSHPRPRSAAAGTLCCQGLCPNPPHTTPLLSAACHNTTKTDHTGCGSEDAIPSTHHHLNVWTETRKRHERAITITAPLLKRVCPRVRVACVVLCRRRWCRWRWRRPWHS